MQAKGLKPSFAWQDIVGEEHNVAFTVAKMMDVELLKTVQGKLEAALADGVSLQEFKNDLIPTLQKAGWWGKKDVVDPLTGQVVKAQLGSASRLETIFRTNLQSAYAVGHWDGIVRSARTAPYLMYDAVDDHRTRPEHAARDGEVHAVYSDFWSTHFPPNGWNCRCGVIQLDKEDLQELGLPVETDPNIKTRKWTNPRTGTVQDVPVDVDPGFDHNPGKARLEHLGGLMDEKALRLQARQRKALERSLEKQRQAQARYEKQLEQDKELLALQKKLVDSAMTSISGAMPAIARVEWGGFRRAAVIEKERPTKDHPDYRASKSGDIDAASRLVADVMGTKAAIGAVERQIRKTDPVVVPVHALEGVSYNVIPVAMSEYIGLRLGLRTSTDILQINRAGHTGASGYHRLASPALFSGDVVEGEEYLLVDDFLGQGGTIANLRGLIESAGGNVVGVVALTGQRRSAILAVNADTLRKLREKHEGLEEWWEGVFGYGFESLTESEARYLYRSPDANTIRNRLVQAAREGGGGKGEGKF